MKKYSTLAVCGLLTAASVLSGCSEEKAVDGTQTALIIDGEELPLGLANYLLRTEQAASYSQMKAMMAYFGGSSGQFWSMEVEDGVTYGDNLKTSLVTEMTQLVEIRRHAEELGVSVTEEEKQQSREAAAAFMEKNAEAMEKLGVSEDNVAEALELKTLETKIRPVILKDTDREVTDEEAAQSVCTYVSLTKPEDAEEAKTAKEQMEDILKQIQDADKDADVSEIAKAVNENCYATSYGFDRGVYDDSNTLETAVKDVLQNLKENEVYDQVIEGDSAYYIVRMDSFFDREKTDSKKETIIQNRESELYSKTLEGWTDGVDAETKDCWDSIAVDDSVIYDIASATEE